MRRVRFVFLLAMSAALAAPLALAQKDAGPNTEPPPVGQPAAQPNASATTNGKDHPAAPAATGGATSDPEGDDNEHPPSAAPPKEKPAPFVKQPTVMKDGMLRIPGGRFTMGSSDKNAPANERPARAVVASAFWIDKTEVTVGAYKACVDRGACARPPRTSASCTYDMGDPQLPVSCVPWASANAFCLAVGKRLPREVEWEMAARGTMSARYPWGGTGTACGMANTLASDRAARSCSGKKPSRVGAHAGGASPYGALDMSGNVEEWVADWYTDAVSELSPRAGASHVLRGGGWLSMPSLARATTRNWGSVREAGPNVGFRCARDD
jgi:formylglycine-generating enzyme required for sulfatase activity